MSLLRLILYFFIIYFAVRMVAKIFSALSGGDKNTVVKGQARKSSTTAKSHQDIEDADYEELK